MATHRLTNKVLDLWKARKPAVTAWMGIGSPYTAEALARQGFDACVVDLQHGMVDEGTVIQMFAAIATVPGEGTAGRRFWKVRLPSCGPTSLPLPSLLSTSVPLPSLPSTSLPLSSLSSTSLPAPLCFSNLLPPPMHDARPLLFPTSPLGVTPLARVRCNQPDKIHFLLDAGALGVICPLINTAQVSWRSRELLCPSFPVPSLALGL